MATLSSVLDGYVMVFILYLFNNGLLYGIVRRHLRLRWWGFLILTAVQSIAVYQILHYVWMGNIFIAFLFFLLFSWDAGVERYKLLHLIMVTTGYTTVCNLLFYMIWGPAYVWGWQEIGWMCLIYSVTAPFTALCMRRVLWPRLLRLRLPNSRWLWIMPAFAISIIMLIGSAHVQFLMTGYEDVYALTSMLVVGLSIGTSLMTLEILQKNQAEANHKHDMEIVRMQIAAQSRRHLEVMRHVDEIRIMRHDLRHHVRIATMLLDEGNYETLRSFLGDMERDPRMHDNIVYSHNRISDLIVHHSMQEARDAQITLGIQCGLPKSFWVNDADLCILLGNLLENAMHACCLQEEGPREIQLRSIVQQEEACIFVENSCVEAGHDTVALRKKMGVPLSGGYGILSVRGIAEKYDGFASFEQQENRFMASVLLKNPSPAAPDAERVRQVSR